MNKTVFLSVDIHPIGDPVWSLSLRSSFFSKPSCARTMIQVALRFGSKLHHDLRFEMNGLRHVCLQLTEELPPRTLRFTDSDCAYVQVGSFFDPTGLPQPDTLELITDTIAAALTTVGKCKQVENLTPIEDVRKELLENGEDSCIWMRDRFRTIKNYRIEPFFKVKGYGASTVQIFVRLTELRTGKIGTRMIIESHEYDALALTGRFAIRGEKLWVFPKTGRFEATSGAMHRERGFSVPIQLELDSIIPLASK